MATSYGKAGNKLTVDYNKGTVSVSGVPETTFPIDGAPKIKQPFKPKKTRNRKKASGYNSANGNARKIEQGKNGVVDILEVHADDGVMYLFVAKKNCNIEVYVFIHSKAHGYYKRWGWHLYLIIQPDERYEDLKTKLMVKKIFFNAMKEVAEKNSQDE